MKFRVFHAVLLEPFASSNILKDYGIKYYIDGVWGVFVCVVLVFLLFLF